MEDLSGGGFQGRPEPVEVVAVAGRSAESAHRFGDAHGIERRYADYEALLHDPDVDVVYVGLPNPFHAEWVARALDAGKPVLCEKPFTITRSEADRLVTLARDHGLFLMEAMRARFVPAIRRGKEIVESGGLGEVRFTQVDVGGVPPSTDAGSRWLSPDLGGGALLDMGVYALSLACHFAGLPDTITAVGTLADTGVDLASSAFLGYASGARAVVTSSLDAQRPGGAVVAGTAGRLEFDGPMLSPTGGRWFVGDELREEFETVPFFESMRFEAAEVVRCLRLGLLESPVMPLDETVALMGAADEIRRQVGVRYPFE